MDIYEFIGVLGFLAYISAYALLQAGYLDGRKAGYTLLNLVAASLVLISLTDKFNLASALIQLSWIAVSLWGLSKLFFSPAKYAHSREDGERSLDLTAPQMHKGNRHFSAFTASTTGSASLALDGAPLTASNGLSVNGEVVPGSLRLRTFLSDQIQLWSLRFAVQQERRTLEKLDDHTLRDIGLDRVDAVSEANKSFLDVPVCRLSDR